MARQPEHDRSIYIQLLEQIHILIIPGVYPTGDRFLSVWNLAAEAAVNPNIMQKALPGLERSGLIYSRRTPGRYITEDAGMIQTLKGGIAEEKIKDLLRALEQFGFESEETTILLQEIIEEMKSWHLFWDITM